MSIPVSDYEDMDFHSDDSEVLATNQGPLSSPTDSGSVMSITEQDIKPDPDSDSSTPPASNDGDLALRMLAPLIEQQEALQRRIAICEAYLLNQQSQSAPQNASVQPAPQHDHSHPASEPAPAPALVPGWNPPIYTAASILHLGANSAAIEDFINAARDANQTRPGTPDFQLIHWATMAMDIDLQRSWRVHKRSLESRLGGRPYNPTWNDFERYLRSLDPRKSRHHYLDQIKQKITQRPNESVLAYYHRFRLAIDGSARPSLRRRFPRLFFEGLREEIRNRSHRFPTIEQNVQEATLTEEIVARGD